MPKLGKGEINRNPIEEIESQGFGKGLKYKRMQGKRFWENWSKEAYGGYKAAMGMAGIGGEDGQGGPDILKFIKQHDPDNSSGAIKDSLDIMQKLQDNSTKKSDLFSSIQPLQTILGGGLYSKMMAAGSAVAASEKASQPEEEEQPPEDIIALLIAAAIEMCTDEDKIIIGQELDANEVLLIRQAYYGNGIYVSAKPRMPVAFVNAINELIPTFRLREQQGAAVS